MLIKKKGKEGAAVKFISRTQALRKLQLDLPAFRRLCILKGIYPREPANKKKVSGGSTAPRTYYYRKDVQLLLHEPLVAQFRRYRVYQLKLKKAISKREWELARSIEESMKPDFKLDHIIKERYPTFTDALKDLDDALSMVLLFSTLAAHDKIPSNRVRECQRLAGEFEAYVANSNALRKVFVSVKGIYYQAVVMNHEITWVVPHRFTQDVPADVDFRIMSTFLDLYVSLLGFVNFKLYHDARLAYPPRLDREKDASGASEMSSYVLESTVNGIVDEHSAVTENLKSKKVLDHVDNEEIAEKIRTIAAKTQDDSKDTQDDSKESAVEVVASEEKIGINPVKTDEEEDLTTEVDNVPTIDELEAKRQKVDALKSLFSSCKFWLSREVPTHSLAFVIKSFGGNVCWENAPLVGGSFAATDSKITHHVIDRPAPLDGSQPEWRTKFGDSRDYIQPQWIYDCVNARRILPTKGYHVGDILPPHLSPFEVYEEGDYVPEAASVSAFAASRSLASAGDDVPTGETEVLDVADVDRLIPQEELEEEDEEIEGENAGDDDNEEGMSSDEEMYQEELKAEAAGLSYSEYMKKKLENGSSKKRKSSSAAANSAKKQKSKKTVQEEEKKDLAKMMMSKKDRRLYDQIEYGKARKAEKVAALTKKRDAAKSAKKGGWNVVER